MSGREGHWTVNYTGTQSLNLVIVFAGLIKKLETFEPIFLIYRRGNFVYYNFGMNAYLPFFLSPKEMTLRLKKNLKA